MEDRRTRWERLQSSFKNSWFGITVLGLIAVAAFLTQVGDSIKRASDWIRVPLEAGLRQIEPSIEPLDKFRHLVSFVGPEPIFPVGATLQFSLVHNLEGEEVISIAGLDVSVDSYVSGAMCPFTLTGDRIFGHGEAPLRVFTVHMADGRVSSVQRKEQRNGPIMHGRNSNLLDIDPPLPLVLRKTNDDIEKIVVTFIVDDAAQYRIRLSLRYSNRGGQKTATISSVNICNPRQLRR